VSRPVFLSDHYCLRLFNCDATEASVSDGVRLILACSWKQNTRSLFQVGGLEHHFNFADCHDRSSQERELARVAAAHGSVVP
jgi:hypothetical protein